MVTRHSLTPSLRAQLICREYELIAENPVNGLYVQPTTDGMKEWCGVVFIRRPDTNPYCRGCYKFMIEFPELYPFDKPICKFITTMYHPAISPETGRTDNGHAWFQQLKPFKDNIAASFLLEIKSLFFDLRVLENPMNPAANISPSSKEYRDKAIACALRSTATAYHPTRDFPRAMRFLEISDTASNTISALLDEKDEEEDTLKWFRASYISICEKMGSLQ
eukprot:TRINITY_DN19870_c0_g1_i1.p1 TRINITY_DN19870_c0_g1~~TRINITY_DN19870_c0_g1_i1.p1  ORF type:complete len:221 (+),score=7.19 TRINITY_DN19870_c0_g1_i1:41-703(+)